jgi:hypothetical protein
MYYDDLLDHFGGLSKAAKALGFSRQTVHGWKIRGSIPFEAQFRIQLKTKGRLKADLRNLERKARKAA